MTTIVIKTIIEPVYTTLVQLAEYTENADLLTLITDEEAKAKKVVVRAEQMIDFMVGFWKKYHSKFLETDPEWMDQRTIFPRLEDYDENVDGTESPYIPNQIHEATLLLTEILFERDEAAQGTQEINSLLLGADSVKLGDFSISKKGNPEGASDLRETVGNFLSETPKGQQVLSYISEFQNLSFEMP